MPAEESMKKGECFMTIVTKILVWLLKRRADVIAVEVTTANDLNEMERIYIGPPTEWDYQP